MHLDDGPTVNDIRAEGAQLILGTRTAIVAVSIALICAVVRAAAGAAAVRAIGVEVAQGVLSARAAVVAVTVAGVGAGGGRLIAAIGHVRSKGAKGVLRARATVVAVARAVSWPSPACRPC